MFSVSDPYSLNPDSSKNLNSDLDPSCFLTLPCAEPREVNIFATLQFCKIFIFQKDYAFNVLKNKIILHFKYYLRPWIRIPNLIQKTPESGSETLHFCSVFAYQMFIYRAHYPSKVSDMDTIVYCCDMLM